ncbi:uncharacterized protein EV420DRAFT_1492686 [Desarmillaria tabescens]|uniref:Uncharacterized protein n=1 Tax=Armillaria tabescens TaxID=1929756 RepID=A0AA39U222_ARMTA|nr:uncharacterized protein EV420DRAFT_1492686 [Desarmillaria tabescens]KAK0469139.1 hypothetical protein EV420DRAFT_1492686 [Desarmillaria tabescens]
MKCPSLSADLWQGIQSEDYLAIMKHASEDQNEITVLANAVNILLNDVESFHSNLMCLITQTSLAAVFRRSAISSILTPIRDIAVEFYGAISAMWKEVSLFLKQGLKILRSETSHNDIANAEHYIRAAQVDYLRACQIIESQFEDLLWDSEELLIAELRGSCGLEILLRLTKQFFTLSSYRLIVMEGIPRRLSMLWDDGREILDCLNHLGEVMSRIQIRFRSPEWRTYYAGREDIIRLLTETFHYTSKWHHSVEVRIWRSYEYNSQELLVKKQYVGLWDPNEFVWDWYSWWS